MLDNNGLVWAPDDSLVEFIELPDHRFFVATQAHPEFKSRPDRAHPLFLGLAEAAGARRRARSSQAAPVAESVPDRT